jgi:hypothetical protein
MLEGHFAFVTMNPSTCVAEQEYDRRFAAVATTKKPFADLWI